MSGSMPYRGLRSSKGTQITLKGAEILCGIAMWKQLFPFVVVMYRAAQWNGHNWQLKWVYQNAHYCVNCLLLIDHQISWWNFLVFGSSLWQKNCWINQENPCSRCCTGRYLLNELGKQNTSPIGWVDNIKQVIAVQALNGFPLSIYRVKGKKLIFKSILVCFNFFCQSV